MGRGTGEPAEVFNSVVGPHGAVTQYMAPANREAHLEHVSRLYSDQASTQGFRSSIALGEGR